MTTPREQVEREIARLESELKNAKELLKKIIESEKQRPTRQLAGDTA